MNLPLYSVYMRGVTWARDSHGLFDYESRSITKKTWVTQDQSKIIRRITNANPSNENNPESNEANPNPSSSGESCSLQIVPLNSEQVTQSQQKD